MGGERGLFFAALQLCRIDLICRAHFSQQAVQIPEDKIVYAAAIAKTYFVLGRVYVDIDNGRVQLQIQHKRRVAAVKQHIAIGLLDGVYHQSIADHAAVNEKMLHIGLTAGEGGQRHPAPKRQARGLRIYTQGIFQKGRAAYPAEAPLLFELIARRRQVVNDLVIVPQLKADIVATQGQPFDHFFKVIEFGLFST